MDSENKDINEFYDDFPYAVIFISWDGLRIIRCKTKEYMKQVSGELRSCYQYFKEVEIKELSEGGEAQ